jgi:putative transposase
MSRRLRVEFPGALYRVVCRGNARQGIFHKEADHRRLIDGLESTVNRFGWELIPFALLLRAGFWVVWSS